MSTWRRQGGIPAFDPERELALAAEGTTPIVGVFIAVVDRQLESWDLLLTNVQNAQSDVAEVEAWNLLLREYEAMFHKDVGVEGLEELLHLPIPDRPRVRTKVTSWISADGGLSHQFQGIDTPDKDIRLGEGSLYRRRLLLTLIKHCRAHL